MAEEFGGSENGCRGLQLARVLTWSSQGRDPWSTAWCTTGSFFNSRMDPARQ